VAFIFLKGDGNMKNNVKLNEGKVLNEYFDYLKSEEATIVYIVKNLVNSLGTKKKWIDVVDFECRGSKGGKPDFKYFVVELFDRRIFPKYPDNASSQLKKALTWETCHNDIGQQKSKGIRGPIFLVTCYLFNKNKAKVGTKLELKPEWEYRVTGCRKMK
jgi:hypothetical protein